MTKDKQKPEILNDSFLSVYETSKTSSSLGIQPPELEHKDQEQNKAPIIQGETAICYTKHTHKSIGPDGIHTRTLRELAEVLTKSLAIISTICHPHITDVLEFQCSLDPSVADGRAMFPLPGQSVPGALDAP